MILTAAVISAIFAGSAYAKTTVKNSVETEQENYIPSYEKCSYENDELWVQKNYYCPEGDIRCKNVTFVIIDKKIGEFKYMRGEYIKGNYYFSDKKYNYEIYDGEDDNGLKNLYMYNKNNSNKNKSIKLRYCK